MTQPADLPRAKFDVMSIRAGDIVFVLPAATGIGTWKQWANVHGQRLLATLRKAERIRLRPRIKKYSHVMLGAGDGLVIHADGHTVALEVVTDALDFTSTQYQVFRRTGMSDADARRVAKAGMRYLQQKYSFAKYFGKVRADDTTQFCSRLVAHAYRAAGVPVSTLPDKDVLPVDLYLACEAADWQDMTVQTVREPLSPQAAEVLGDIAVPGLGPMGIAEFLENADRLVLDGLKLQKRQQELMHKNHRDVLHSEAMLAAFCGHEFSMAKQTHARPELINDAFAAKVARVLSQLDTLLDLASLPSIDLLVAKTLVNTDRNGLGTSAYAGMPMPDAIYEMQTGRETVRIYTYLLMAQTGLFSILAQHFPNDAVDAFKVVKPEYTETFLAALPMIGNLPAYKVVPDPFEWAGNDRDRKMCRTLYRNIITSVEAIDLASQAGTAN